MILEPTKVGMEDRRGPIPSGITHILYGPELPVYFVKEDRAERLKGEKIIVGRDKESCQLLLSEQTTSRQHAKFVLRNSTWYLTDLYSHNGTFLNGCKLEPWVAYYLCPDDEITFGYEKVIFDSHKIASPKPIGSQTPDKYAPPLPKMQPYISAYNLCRLSGLLLCYRNDRDLLIDEERKPLELRDAEGEMLTIYWAGVEKESSIEVFLDKTVHPKCCAVFSYNDAANTWMIRDCGTEEGVCVNRWKLPAMTEHRLTAGDIIQFGKNAYCTFGNQMIAGQYRVLRKIGRNSFGTNYLVELQRVKRLFVARVMDKTDPKHQPMMRECFSNWIQWMMHLAHPMLPRLVDIIEDKQQLIAVQDYVLGETLGDVAEKHGAFSVESVMDIALQMCEVLEYLHSMNPPRIHRDIKPCNMIRKPDGKLVLVGFDCMVWNTPNEIMVSPALGTRGYAAPEQYLLTGESTAATDIYGLGVTLHQLVTGKDPQMPPYDLPPIRQLNPNLPEKLEKIICKCTERDPQNRYQTCAELRAALQKPEKDSRSFRNWFRK